MQALLDKQKSPENEELNIGKKAQSTHFKFNELALIALEISNIEEKDFLKKLDKTKDIVGQIIKLDSKNIDLAKFLFNINYKSYIKFFDKSLLNNKEILSILLKKDSEIFRNNFEIKDLVYKLLKKDYSKNKNIVFLVLNNFIKNNSSIDEVKAFIEDISGENKDIKDELNESYSSFLSKAGRIYENNIKKNLFEIEEKKSRKIVESKILDKNGVINKKILKAFEKEINSLENGEKEKSNIIQLLLEKFNLKLEDLKNNGIKSLLDSVYNLLQIEIKSEIVDEINNTEEKSKLEKKNKYNKSVKNNNNEEFKEDSELLDFCTGSCILSEIGGEYKIDTGYNQIQIKKEEYKKFSSENLKNYLDFNTILYETGLSFLFENKYKSGFIQLLNSELNGFSYTSGEGFSKFNILRTLNVIAHLIGVPKSYYKEEGKLGKFTGKTEAMNVFKEINSTGTINNQNLVNPGNIFDSGAAEKRMLENGVLGENGGFQIITAENLLRKGGYINEEK